MDISKHTDVKFISLLDNKNEVYHVIVSLGSRNPLFPNLLGIFRVDLDSKKISRSPSFYYVDVLFGSNTGKQFLLH